MTAVADDAHTLADAPTVSVMAWRRAEGRRQGGAQADLDGELQTRAVFYAWVRTPPASGALINGLTKGAIRKLLARGGAWPVANLVYDEVRFFLLDTMYDVIHTMLVELGTRQKTVSTLGVASALERHHIKTYGAEVHKRAPRGKHARGHKRERARERARTEEPGSDAD